MIGQSTGAAKLNTEKEKKATEAARLHNSKSPWPVKAEGFRQRRIREHCSPGALRRKYWTAFESLEWRYITPSQRVPFASPGSGFTLTFDPALKTFLYRDRRLGPILG